MRLGLIGGISFGVALLYACVPSSFDGLTGGTRDGGTPDGAPDLNLAPPRPIAPISVSWVNTLRPELRWSLPVSATGAVVELCKSRACDPVEHTYEVRGGNFVVPEDLSTGMWFWRLRSMTGGTRGLTTSPTWQFLLRGPAAKGSSAVPEGSVADINGDGIADLQIVNTLGDLEVYFGELDGRFTLSARIPVAVDAINADTIATIASGMDINGDGFADTIVALGPSDPADGGSTYPFVPLLGSSAGLKVAAQSPRVPYAAGMGRSISAAGDYNGDGYGDFVVGSNGSALVVLGDPSLGSSVVSMTGFSPESRSGQFVLGGFDWNGDGFSDALAGIHDREGHGVRTYGGGVTGVDVLRSSLDSAPPRAIGAAAALDIDGDGRLDLAFAPPFAPPCPPLDGKEVLRCGGICGLKSSDARYDYCAAYVAIGPALIRLASVMTAVDLEGTGKDTLLHDTAVKSGDTTRTIVNAFVFPNEPLEVEEEREIPASATYGTKLTTIYPGRPGKGRWAAARADGALGVIIFDGETPLRTLPTVAAALR